MKYITHVRLHGGRDHRHITDVQWTENGETGTSTTAEMVRHLRRHPDDVWVKVGHMEIKVAIVQPTDHEPFLRTIADGQWSDNLLALAPF